MDRLSLIKYLHSFLVLGRYLSHVQQYIVFGTSMMYLVQVLYNFSSLRYLIYSWNFSSIRFYLIFYNNVSKDQFKENCFVSLPRSLLYEKKWTIYESPENKMCLPWIIIYVTIWPSYLTSHIVYTIYTHTFVNRLLCLRI